MVNPFVRTLSKKIVLVVLFDKNKILKKKIIDIEAYFYNKYINKINYDLFL